MINDSYKKASYEIRNIDDLIPYVNNAKIHSEKQVSQIASSIKEFGFINPIIIDNENGIIAGHGRLMGAKKLGLKSVPVIVESHLTEAQKKAYILADNKIAENAEWDNELLSIELADLQDLGFDNLDAIGFSEDEINDLLNGDNTPADDTYTSKVDTPQYEIQGNKPKLKELYNSDKTNKLIEEIENTSIPKDIKEFLKIASYRHTVFNYKNIAEYYANAPKEVQELFEHSALVIIDINNAIKNGFTQLTTELEEELHKEYD